VGYARRVQSSCGLQATLNRIIQRTTIRAEKHPSWLE
jgi:hypothetical protein